MASKQIKITCKGSRSVPIDRLFNFQGNLKTLERNEADKLKRSILKHGFAFPVMVWDDKILDGHQRVFVVREMLQQGYKIADIPVVDIQAETESEAAEKLLLINSHYAKITDEGLYEFLNEHSVDISGLAGDLELPDIDMEKFIAGYVAEIEAEKIQESENDKATDQVIIKIVVSAKTWSSKRNKIKEKLDVLLKEYKMDCQINE